MGAGNAPCATHPVPPPACAQSARRTTLTDATRRRGLTSALFSQKRASKCHTWTRHYAPAACLHTAFSAIHSGGGEDVHSRACADTVYRGAASRQAHTSQLWASPTLLNWPFGCATESRSDWKCPRLPLTENSGHGLAHAPTYTCTQTDSAMVTCREVGLGWRVSWAGADTQTRGAGGGIALFLKASSGPVRDASWGPLTWRNLPPPAPKQGLPPSPLLLPPPPSPHPRCQGNPGWPGSTPFLTGEAPKTWCSWGLQRSDGIPRSVVQMRGHVPTRVHNTAHRPAPLPLYRGWGWMDGCPCLLTLRQGAKGERKTKEQMGGCDGTTALLCVLTTAQGGVSGGNLLTSIYIAHAVGQLASRIHCRRPPNKIHVQGTAEGSDMCTGQQFWSLLLEKSRKTAPPRSAKAPDTERLPNFCSR